jgi:hypothetical protein
MLHNSLYMKTQKNKLVIIIASVVASICLLSAAGLGIFLLVRPSRAEDAPTSWTVTFDSNNNSGVTCTQTLEVGQPLKSFADILYEFPGFSRAGYGFTHWATLNDSILYNNQAFELKTDSSFDTTNRTVTLYAQHLIKTYTVTFVTDMPAKDKSDKPITVGGVMDSAHVTDNQASITYGTNVSIGSVYTPTIDPAYENDYFFAGWFLSDDFTDELNVPLDDLRDPQGSNGSFAHFFASTASDNITLYAGYSQAKYYISFDPNMPDGVADKVNNKPTGSMLQSVPATQVPAFPLPHFGYNIQGWHFLYWTTKPDGTGTKYFDGQGVSGLTESGETVTLHAQWAPNVYKIKYNPGDVGKEGDSVIPDKEVAYDYTSSADVATFATVHTNTFSSTGRTFFGWTREEGGFVVESGAEREKYEYGHPNYDSNNSIVYFANTPYDKNIPLNWTDGDNAEINLYAVWEANSYALEFNTQTGQVINGNAWGAYENQFDGDYDFGSELPDALQIQKKGYVFLGWYLTPMPIQADVDANYAYVNALLTEHGSIPDNNGFVELKDGNQMVNLSGSRMKTEMDEEILGKFTGSVTSVTLYARWYYKYGSIDIELGKAASDDYIDSYPAPEVIAGHHYYGDIYRRGQEFKFKYSSTLSGQVAVLYYEGTDTRVSKDGDGYWVIPADKTGTEVKLYVMFENA